MSLVVGYEFSLGSSTGIGVKSTNYLYKLYIFVWRSELVLLNHHIA